tara:strand:+ start:1757 stop:2269 length:513 start_codon:yes stop_codon:yes gene_type:complete
MSVLNITYLDFGKGKYELHSGIYEQAKINDYINKYEKIYLIRMLGADLYNLFVADLVAGVPVTAKYLALYNSFEYDSGCGDIVISEGLKDIVKGFVYFQYLKDQTNQVWVSGSVAPSGENSKNVSTLNMMIYTRFNDSVRSYRAVQRYICDNSTDYSKYNGRGVSTAYWI